MFSNHYLALKYQVNEVVGVVKGNHRIARSCYSTAAKETMQITSLDTRGDMKIGRQELDEEVETVSIQQGQIEKVVKIRSKVEANVKERLVSCLKKYADVFA